MIKLIGKTDILDRGFVGIPCIANASIGVKAVLPYLSKICLVKVFDKNKEPNTQNSQSSGTNIKNFTFTCQKNSFIELKIDFDKNIKDITGLPKNLYLDNNYIKGTIQRAGQYLISISFKDDTRYDFILEVPNLQRIL